MASRLLLLAGCVLVAGLFGPVMLVSGLGDRTTVGSLLMLLIGEAGWCVALTGWERLRAVDHDARLHARLDGVWEGARRGR